MKKEQTKWFNKIIFTKEQIEEKCVELAKWIDNTYELSNKELVLVGLMKGSIPFMAELMKSVTVNHIIDFMTVSSFDGGTESKGNVKLIMDLKFNLRDKDVLVIEDIVDSGLTLKWVENHINQMKPNSLKLLTLLDKPKGRKTNIKVDKYGFEVPNIFLAGFGLDVKEKLRNIPFIGEFNKNKLDEL